jgi:predicted PurR-regulated permease PerM
MDILSFVLGIVAVVIIGLSIVVVVSFFKVKKIEKQLANLESGIYREIQFEISNTHQKIDGLEKEVFSQIDSRLDKLENKLSTIKK